MMRPPICAICHKDFRNSDEGGLVSFKETAEDKAFNLYFTTSRMVGHKKALEWFCGEHIEAAQKYKHLTWSEAKPLIVKETP